MTPLVARVFSSRIRSGSTPRPYPWYATVASAYRSQSTTRPDVVPDRPESHPLVDELLDLVQQDLALPAIGHERLLLVERVDVRVAAIRVGAGAGDVLRDPRRGVAIGRRRADAEPAQLLGLQRRGIGGALHRPHLQPDPDGPEIAHDRFAHREVGRQLMQLSGVEAIGIARFGQELL